MVSKIASAHLNSKCLAVRERELHQPGKVSRGLNFPKSNCLAVMDEYGIDSVPIDEGGKRLVRFSEMKLKTAKAENEGEG